MALLIYEGDISHRIPVQDAMREMHEAEREARDKDIAKRKEKGAPPDEKTDFGALAVRAQALIAALEAEDIAAFDAALVAAQVGVRGVPRPLGPYEPDEDLDGVQVVVRAVSQKTLRTLDMRVHDAIANAGAARILDERLAAEDAYADARDAFVLATVQEVVLASGSAIAPTDVKHLDAFKRAGIFDALFAVSSRWQRLPPGKAQRFGLPAPSTSPASTAAPAQSATVVTAAVTAEPSPDTSPARSTPPTDAPSGTSSTTPTSLTPSPSLEQRAIKASASGVWGG